MLQGGVLREFALALVVLEGGALHLARKVEGCGHSSFLVVAYLPALLSHHCLNDVLEASAEARVLFLATLLLSWKYRPSLILIQFALILPKILGTGNALPILGSDDSFPFSLIFGKKSLKDGVDFLLQEDEGFLGFVLIGSLLVEVLIGESHHIEHHIFELKRV